MKAKIIIDMPEHCCDCQFRRPSIQTYGYICCVTLDSLTSYRSGDKKPANCPLREVKELKSAYIITPDVPSPLPQGLKDHIIRELYIDIGRQLSHFLKVKERKIPIMENSKMEDFTVEKCIAFSITDWCNTEFSVTLNL